MKTLEIERYKRRLTDVDSVSRYRTILAPCMIMATRRDSSSSLAEKCAFLLVIVATVVATADAACDKTKCPGPLHYYESLGCKAVYEKEGDCCAIRYDCDHLKARSTKKCYVNDHSYEVGESLRDEDKNPCDIGCICRDYNEVASFVCAVVDCFGPVREGCYRKRDASQCCPGEEVCPEKPEDVAKCEVDGKTYQDGDYFQPESDPSLTCYCQPGYKGENVEPFCIKPRRPYCAPDFRGPSNIQENCAPVYYNEQSPQTDCSVSTRCQNPKDQVIHAHDESRSHDEGMTCSFGNLEMHLGDELNQATDYSSVCVKCVCEVPPVPTCQRLPDSECDVTKHPQF